MCFFLSIKMYFCCYFSCHFHIFLLLISKVFFLLYKFLVLASIKVCMCVHDFFLYLIKNRKVYNCVFVFNHASVWLNNSHCKNSCMYYYSLPPVRGYLTFFPFFYFYSHFCLLFYVVHCFHLCLPFIPHTHNPKHISSASLIYFNTFIDKK